MLVRGYGALDADCPCRVCWVSGLYEHRGATLSGSRNTGSVTHECLTRACRGCPAPLPAAAHDFGRRRACARCGLPPSAAAPTPGADAIGG